MSQPSLKRNFVLNTIYNILIIVIPFVTAPYIARVLGAEHSGIYSYTYSIQFYFAMFAALGTVTYGTREIARCREDKELRSKTFWEIELLTVCTSLVMLVIWGGFIFLNAGSSLQMMYIVLTGNILAVLFDISWFYAGMERFEFIVIQNSVCKLAGVVALFLLVKGPEDLIIYTVIMVLSTLLGNMSMWIYLGRFVKGVPISQLKLLPHLKETLIYFVPTIATTIYSVLDKTLIGIITQDNKENGYYEYATSILNAAKALAFVAINGVMESRSSYLFGQNRADKARELLHETLEYVLFISVGMTFGICAVAGDFVPWFYGPGYGPVARLMTIMSPLVIIIGISYSLGCQYYTPAGLRATSAKFLIAGSIVNLILNIVLIPVLGANGAAIASVIAETIITGLYVGFCQGFVKLIDLVLLLWKKLLAGVIMLFSLIEIGKYMDNSLIMLILKILIGVIIYSLAALLLKDKFFIKLKNMLRDKKDYTEETYNG